MSLSGSIKLLNKKLEKYQTTFNNLYFLICSHTNRRGLNDAFS